MVKTRKRSISLLVALAFVLTLVLPLGAALGATGSISALSAPVYSDDASAQPQTLSRVRVEVPAGSISVDDAVIFSLPPGFHFDADADGDADDIISTNSGYAYASVQSQVYNYVYVPPTVGSSTSNGLLANQLQVENIGDNEVRITAKADQSLTEDLIFYIYFGAIVVDPGTSDDCVVTFTAASGSGFPTGSVVIGTSTEGGEVTLAAMATQTSTDEFTFNLRIKEAKGGALSATPPSIKLTLPDGYEWASPQSVSVTTLWGDTKTFTVTPDGEVLKITPNSKTSVASAWDIKGLKFSVVDESKVEPGDIVAKVSGKSSLGTTELKVGTSGEYAASIKVDGDVPTLYAGRDEQEIADLVIAESLTGTLQQYRTITLTLPEGAAWQPVYADYAADGDYDGTGALDDSTTNKSLKIEFVTFSGAEKRTAKFKVATESTGASAKVYLRDFQVALAPGFTGDLTVTVGGTAGLSGELVVAKVVAPVKLAASATPEVVIGKTGQAAGDVTIVETKAGALLDDGKVNLTLPDGVEFDGTPTVTVSAGDLKIVGVKTSGDTLSFTVDRESTEPSTITISGIKLKLYHTPPQGAVKLSIGGSAVSETSGYKDYVDEWPGADKVAIANAVALESQPSTVTHYTAVLTVGSTTMTVNGEAVNMDVAPYIDTATNRTYVPVRYVAQALGVTADNIYFSNGVVTLLKDSRAVQMTIGSKTLVVNGVAVSMDAAPVIVSGRTMLPFRWVATALGASVSWDEAAKSVTVEL